ncbi:MAG: glycosyltransferase [Armatimonadetes bacterium]|nr:glycosyltransferase [Armatimonadota bacterium]
MALIYSNPVSAPFLPLPASAAPSYAGQRACSTLILSCNYGGGHRSAAQALSQWWAHGRSHWQVTVFDYFSRFVHPLYARATEFSYVQSVRLFPPVYGFFYELTANIPADSRTQQFINHLGKQSLLRYLRQHPADLVACVHPTPAGALSDLKRDGLIDCQVATVVTDLVIHSQWIHPYVDLYLVGSDCVREGLIRRGIRPERIRVTGIPIVPRFTEGVNRQAARRQLRVRPELPGVLVMVGAAGMIRKAIDIYYAIEDLPVELFFVCGQDQHLRSRLRALTHGRPRFHVLGFVDNVPELMAACDFMVSKAGGLTISEALAMELPMLIYRPIPGQEHANRDYLVHVGAAVSARNQRELRQRLIALCSNPGLLKRMRAAAHAVRRPYATEDAARAMAALVEGVEP